MSFFHGARWHEVPTAIIPPANINPSLTMAFGTAPIHRLPAEQQEKVKPGNIALLFNNGDAATQMGIDGANDDNNKWGLSGLAFTLFSLFNSAPVIFANLFDPDKHKTNISAEIVIFEGNTGKLKNTDIMGNITLTGASTTYQIDTDYTFNPFTGTISVLSKALEDAIATQQQISASYTYADPSMVTSADCIGGFDVATGKSTGLELLELAYPKYKMPPGIIRCPILDRDPIVVAVATAKARKYNGVFGAVVYADIPDEEVKLHTNAPKYKSDNNLVSEDLFLCYPKVRVGERIMSLADQLVGITYVTDAASMGIPYKSPSNKNLQCTGAVIDGKDWFPSLPDANYLNANGIVCPLNFSTGWNSWGNWTGTFPGNTDPKDMFLCIRRMIKWIGNTLILTWFPRIDEPQNRRNIQTIITSTQPLINSWTNIGALTGGRIEYIDENNPLTDRLQGISNLHFSGGFVPPMKEINFFIEFDTDYTMNLA